MTENDRHTHIHIPMPTVDFASTNTYISGAPLLNISRNAFIVYRHKSLSTGDLVDDDRRAYAYLCLMLAQTHIQSCGAFLFHTYRRVSLTCMQCYTRYAYLFHQCGTSLLSRDGRITDCTVRHQLVEHLFSSSLLPSVVFCTFKDEIRATSICHFVDLL